MSKMQEAAEARLKALASGSTKVLFICEQADRRSLDSHLARSQVFTASRIVVVDSGQPEQIDGALSGATFLVAFTNTATIATFIDSALDKALLKRIGVLHVQAHDKALIPSKVTAYRWRSVTWDQLEAIFK
jgi:hypothetical protein